MNFDPETTAAIAIHYQGDIVGPDGAFAPLFHDQIVERSVIYKIASLQKLARGSGMKMIYTRVAWKPEYSDLQADSPERPANRMPERGKPQSDILDQLAPHPGDLVVTHQRVGGFTPELQSTLQGQGIDALLFCGATTNVFVESTARVASEAGYNVILGEDACSAASVNAHQASVESLAMLGKVTTMEELQQKL